MAKKKVKISKRDIIIDVWQRAIMPYQDASRPRASSPGQAVLESRASYSYVRRVWRELTRIKRLASDGEELVRSELQCGVATVTGEFRASRK